MQAPHHEKGHDLDLYQSAHKSPVLYLHALHVASCPYSMCIVLEYFNADQSMVLLIPSS